MWFPDHGLLTNNHDTTMSKFAYEHPQTGRVQTFEHPGVMTFLLGLIYFLIVQAWMPALVCLVATMATGGLGWIVCPFLAESFCRRYYEGQGWKECGFPERKISKDESGAGIILAAIGVCSLILLGFMAWMKWGL